MTKKVLISLDELKEICWQYHYDISPDDWFHAQTDVSAVIYTESSPLTHEFSTKGLIKNDN